MSMLYSQMTEDDRERKQREKGWKSKSTTFDLAHPFTHNPRLMSPSSFRSPPKAPALSGELVSFDHEASIGGMDLQCTGVRTSTPDTQSSTSSSLMRGQTVSPEARVSPASESQSRSQLPYTWDRTFLREDQSLSPQDHSFSPEEFFSLEVRSVSLDNQIFSPEGQPSSPEANCFSPQGQTISPGDASYSPDKEIISPGGDSFSPTTDNQVVSPGSQTSQPQDQTSSTEDQVSIPTRPCRSSLSRAKECEFRQAENESGISLFSDTKFNTTEENVGEEESHKSVSDFSDGSSSELNWSLSASYSSSASSRSQSDQGERSLSADVIETESASVCARRRRRRRKISVSRASTASPDGTQVVSSNFYFGGSFTGNGTYTANLSQCSAEVSCILAGAPPCGRNNVARSPIGQIKRCCGYRSDQADEVMNWDDFRAPGKGNFQTPVKRKYLTPFYPHGNSSCNASHCLQRRRRGFRPPRFSQQQSSEASTESYNAAWPALPSCQSPKPTENHLDDPAIVSIGTTDEDKSTPCPQKIETVSVDSRATQHENRIISFLLNGAVGHRCVHPNVSSTRFDTLLQDPAVLYACRQYDTNATLPYRVLENRYALPVQQQYCRTLPVGDDPAILALGAPMFSVYAGMPTYMYINGY
ncbi:uncharacterized protein LOC110977501 [Acanthaster planci]|uniref:Uncharacterized protein LOC110977501 n=1 Tax=Acanthaster planci TaxID=133434 RepID=A0A8B7Y4C8_ACAPL|nr:uncharacterized protein LOC110977501 [Acanthaster planci]